MIGVVSKGAGPQTYGRLREARLVSQRDRRRMEQNRDGSLLTWDDIPGVHGILVLDETEAIHELDLGDLASAMRGEVRLDIGLGSWCRQHRQALPVGELLERLRELTIPGQIAQVEPGGRYLSHCVASGWPDSLPEW